MKTGGLSPSTAYGHDLFRQGRATLQADAHCAGRGHAPTTASPTSSRRPRTIGLPALWHGARCPAGRPADRVGRRKVLAGARRSPPRARRRQVARLQLPRCVLVQRSSAGGKLASAGSAAQQTDLAAVRPAPRAMAQRARRAARDAAPRAGDARRPMMRTRLPHAPRRQAPDPYFCRRVRAPAEAVIARARKRWCCRPTDDGDAAGSSSSGPSSNRRRPARLLRRPSASPTRTGRPRQVSNRGIDVLRRSTRTRPRPLPPPAEGDERSGSRRSTAGRYRAELRHRVRSRSCVTVRYWELRCSWSRHPDRRQPVGPTGRVPARLDRARAMLGRSPRKTADPRSVDPVAGGGDPGGAGPRCP